MNAQRVIELGRRSTDFLMILYLLATAALILFHRESVPHWGRLIAFHIIGAGILLALGRIPFRLPAILQFFRDWYPIFLFPVLYKEVELLARSFGNWELTRIVADAEEVLFQSQPAVWTSEVFDWYLFSEYLHVCYLSFLALLPVIGGVWYFRQRRDGFHELLLTISGIYLVCFFFYILYPVDSPFYLLDPPAAPLSDGPVFRLVHFFSDRGGARGGAFPSTHVAISTGIWMVTWKYDRRLGLGLFLLIPGLYLATVYGRFHYALDVFAGWAVAVPVVWLVRRHLESPRQG